MNKVNSALALVAILFAASAVADEPQHVSGGETATYEVTAVRVDGDIRVCPGAHRPTGTGIEMSGCEGADPVTVESEVDRRCPGAKLTGITPQLTNTTPRGVRSLILMVDLPEAGCSS